MVPKTKGRLSRSGELLVFVCSTVSNVPVECCSALQVLSQILEFQIDMAATNPDYEAFLAWELKARDAVERRYPKLTLIKEAQEEWTRKTRHQQYTTALEALRDSLRDAEDRDNEIYVVGKKRGRARPAPLDAQRTRQRTLVAARQAWRSVRRNLRPFRLEQAEQDAQGQIIANERSQKYSTQLVDQAEAKILQYGGDIDQCRSARKALGSKLSLTNVPEDSESEESESDASDDTSDDEDSSDEDSGDESESERTEGEVDKGEEDENPVDQPEGPKSPESRSRRGESDASGKAGKDPRRVPKKPGGVRGPKTSRKRKSGDDEDTAKKPPTKKRSPVGRQPRRSTSAKPGASNGRNEYISSLDEDTPSEPLSEESRESDEQRLSNKALLNRWNALLAFAEKTRKNNVKWARDFATHRHNALIILENEGWAIFPEDVTEATDLRKLLDELGARLADARKKMVDRRDRRELHPPKVSELGYKLGFGGPRGENPVGGDFFYHGATPGEGAFGHTTIWIRHDEYGNIVERVVVKDLRPKGEEWNSDQNFYGEGRARTPREAYMHELASKQDPDALCIVRIRGKAVFWKKHLLRIYMEYCQYGDFFDAWTRHLERVEGEDLSDRFLGAPILWAFFESLARATHIMTFGALPGGEELISWEPMIHRDVKPENGELYTPVMLPTEY